MDLRARYSRSSTCGASLEVAENSVFGGAWFELGQSKGLYAEPSRGFLDAHDLICYKNFFALTHGFETMPGAYSAVAQWQSIRLLTGGL